MPARVARDNGETFREHVDDFAFALVAPLRTYDYRTVAFLQLQLRGKIWRGRPDRFAGSHTPVATLPSGTGGITGI